MFRQSSEKRRATMIGREAARTSRLEAGMFRETAAALLEWFTTETVLL
jgi:hypothetical protein